MQGIDAEGDGDFFFFHQCGEGIEHIRFTGDEIWLLTGWQQN